MTHVTDLLQAELVRHFDLAALQRMASESLGIDPAELATYADAHALARALVTHCESEEHLEVLLDVVVWNRASALIREVWSTVVHRSEDGRIPSAEDVAQVLAERAGASSSLRKGPAQEASTPVSEPPPERAEARIDWLLERADHEEGPVRAATLREIATLYEDRLDSAREALVVWLQSLGDAPTADSTLRAVERLASTREHWSEAIDVLKSGSDEWSSKDAWRREHLLGSWYARGLERWEEATKHFERALDLDPPKERRAELWTEVGRLWERQSDPEKAREAYRNALEADPTQVIAADRFGHLAFEAKDFEDVVRCCEPLLNRLQDLPKEMPLLVCLRTGDAFRELGRWESAERSYLHAKGFAPDDQGVLMRLADATFRGGEADEAAELHRELLTRFDADLAGPERGLLLFRLGEALLRSGQAAEAIEPFEGAIPLLSDKADALRSLTKALELAERWEDAASVCRRRLASASEDERFGLLVLIGDFRSRDDPEKAAGAFEEALALRHDDRNVLAKLMRIYTDDRRWPRLLEILGRIAELEADPKNQAKFHHTAATILRRELHQNEKAAASYRRALEGDATLDSAFEGLVDCLNELGDSDGLIGAYRHRLDELKESPATDDATPDPRVGLYESLANVYARMPAPGPSKAITTHLALLSAEPDRIASYRALRRLYADLGKPDGAWCASQVLVALGKASDEETAHYKAHRVAMPVAFNGGGHQDLWRFVRRPDEDACLSSLMSTIEVAIDTAMSDGPSTLIMKESERRDPDGDDRGVVDLMRRGTALTGIAVPPLFGRSDLEGSVGFVRRPEPGLVLGDAALEVEPTQALAFLVGRNLVYFRPPYRVRRSVRSLADLRSWVIAALRFALPSAPVASDLQASVEEKLVVLREHLHGDGGRALCTAVTHLLQSSEYVDLRRWMRVVDLTADRLGLILANDLTVASALIAKGPSVGGLTAPERRSELCRYVVSEEYLDLRADVGISVGVGS